MKRSRPGSLPDGKEKTMTPKDILRIRKHLWLLEGKEQALGNAFYSRLFEIAPELIGLFRHDLQLQGQKLIAMLTHAVNLMDQPDVLIPTLRRLGAQHASFGVELAHFEPAGAALLHVLSQFLSGVFDDDAWRAWTMAITEMTDHMALGLQEARLTGTRTKPAGRSFSALHPKL
jgi:hemoglobin-like flavoprotein